MKTKLLVFILSFIFFEALFAFHPIFASTPEIISAPKDISMGDQFTVSASMSGLSSGSIYRLRIAFAQSGTSNYFGSTFNGTEYYNGTPSPINYSKYLTITINQDGSWNGDVLGKLEPSDTNYKNTGSGAYDLKIGRYTENGSTATWSNILSVNLNAPSATPTLAPTTKPSLTNSPTPKLTATNTQAPTKSPTPIKSTTPTKVQSNSKSNSQTKAVLGNKISISPTSSKTNQALVESASKDNTLIPKLIISIGIVFLLLCGIVVAYPMVQKYRKERNG